MRGLQQRVLLASVVLAVLLFLAWVEESGGQRVRVGRRQDDSDGDAENTTQTKTSKNTTTVVDVVIEKNVSYGGDNDANAPTFPDIEDDGGLSPTQDDPDAVPETAYALWYSSMAIYSGMALLLAFCVYANQVGRRKRRKAGTVVEEVSIKRRRADRLLQTLMLKYTIVAAQYISQAADLGLLYEIYFVEVREGIIDEPGKILRRPANPRVFWGRNISWLLSTTCDLSLIMEFASMGGKGVPLNKEKRVSWEMKFYIITLNLMIQVLGLVATLTFSEFPSKWLYWVFGAILFVMMMRELSSSTGLLYHIAAKNKVENDYITLIRTVLVTWSLYPLVWAVGDGSRTAGWEIREILWVTVDLFEKTLFLVTYLEVALHDSLPRWLNAGTRLTIACFRVTDGSHSEGHSNHKTGSQDQLRGADTHHKAATSSYHRSNDAGNRHRRSSAHEHPRLGRLNGDSGHTSNSSPMTASPVSHHRSPHHRHGNSHGTPLSEGPFSS